MFRLSEIYSDRIVAVGCFSEKIHKYYKLKLLTNFALFIIIIKNIYIMQMILHNI